MATTDASLAAARSVDELAAAMRRVVAAASQSQSAGHVAGLANAIDRGQADPLLSRLSEKLKGRV